MKHARFSIAAVMLPVMMSVGCNHQDRQPQQVSRPVKAVRIGEQPDASVVSFSGEVKARYETTLSFRVAGKLLARQIDVGDRVREGEVLAKLDPTDYRLAVRGLKAQLASAVADRNFLKDDLTRYRELLVQQVISPPEFDRHETAYITARERVASLEAQIAQAVNTVDYTELRADRDGVVTALEVEAGQVVSAGQSIIKLAQLDEKEVHFDIPEHRLSGLKHRQEVSVTLWADDDRRFKANIREIASAADPASRTYRVKASLLEGLEFAQLGMTATVWMPSNASPKIAVPLAAAFTPHNKPGQPHVWLVDERTGTVKSMPVQVGEALDGERIAVTGLMPGQLIVSAGVQRLAEGQPVRLPKTVASAMNNESGEHQP